MEISPKLLGLGAAAGLVAAMWDKIRFGLSKINSLFFVSVTTERNASTALLGYLWHHYTPVLLNKHSFTSLTEYVRPEKRKQLIIFQKVGVDIFLFRKGLRVIGCSQTRSNSVRVNGDKRSFVFTFLRGTINYKKLLIESEKYFNLMMSKREEEIRERYKVIRVVGKHSKHSGYGEGDDEYEHYDEDFDENEMLRVGAMVPLTWKLSEIGEVVRQSYRYLYFPAHIEKCFKDAETWLKSEDWCRDKGLPWKRGWLLLGQPGVGKTSFIRALAQYLDLPIFSFDLASMSNKEMISQWERLKSRVPCVALFEDFDCIFDQRRNVSHTRDEDTLTFECVLNLIDGVGDTNGIFVAITANDRSKISNAIAQQSEGEQISRPGRIDKVIEFGLMDKPERERMAEHILKEYPDRWEEVIDSGDGETGAQFQRRCADIALKKFWE